VVGIFPNKAANLHLVSAVLMEISDEWEARRICLSPALSGTQQKQPLGCRNVGGAFFTLISKPFSETRLKN
jgi:hypothetical protein